MLRNFWLMPRRAADNTKVVFGTIPMHRMILPLAAALMAAPAQAADNGRLGFVVTTWNTAIYESRFMDECPEGLNPGNDEFWWRGLNKEDRGRLTQNGMVTQIERQGYALMRGPKGENVCQTPEAVNDPPLLTVEGLVSYGVNLDGTQDGRATAKSWCPSRPPACATPTTTSEPGIFPPRFPSSAVTRAPVSWSKSATESGS